MDKIRVQLLGQPAIDPAGSLSTPVPPSLQPLLGYLAIEPSPALHRDRVLAALWPEVEPDKSRRRLNTAVWRLRRLFGDQDGRIVQCSHSGYLALEADAVDIDARDLVDVALLLNERARTVADRDLVVIREIENLEFLSGCYHEWAVATRVRLEHAMARYLEASLRRHIADGDADQAVDCALRLLARDPYREDVHRTLIQLYTQLGCYDDAERQYDHCVHELRTGLDVEPMTETVLAITEARHKRLADCQPADTEASLADSLDFVLQHCRSAMDEIELATRRLGPLLRSGPRRDRLHR